METKTFEAIAAQEGRIPSTNAVGGPSDGSYTSEKNKKSSAMLSENT
jgi:hypothetical protein